MVLKTKKDVTDNELVYLASENNEDATNILFDKYKYIVDITVSKYTRSAHALNLDKDELYQEAMVGYADAIRSFDPTKDIRLQTFISLCVERRLSNYIRKNNTTKVRILKECYSFDNKVSDELTLADIVGDNKRNPEVIKENAESLKELKRKIDETLSDLEKQVLELLVNDFTNEDIAKILKVEVKSIYNATHRIRAKLKDVI
jgi:RNA polymerase sporulation-specific sigma factor